MNKPKHLTADQKPSNSINYSRKVSYVVYTLAARYITLSCVCSGRIWYRGALPLHAKQWEGFFLFFLVDAE